MTDHWHFDDFPGFPPRKPVNPTLLVVSQSRNMSHIAGFRHYYWDLVRVHPQAPAEPIPTPR